MGQLHIFSERALAFSAYVNSRDFVSSLYRSIITHIGYIKDNSLYKLFQSNILECFIDDKRYGHLSYFRKAPKLANIIEPAIVSIRKSFQEIYDSLLDENEYV